MAGKVRLSSAQIEDQIKALQAKLAKAKAKAKESTTRFSMEIRKRLKNIMENHALELTDAEYNVIANPCEIVEKMYFDQVTAQKPR